MSVSYTLFDGAAVIITKQRKGEYGLQRMYGSLGGVLFPFASGLLIDAFRAGGPAHFTDY